MIRPWGHVVEVMHPRLKDVGSKGTGIVTSRILNRWSDGVDVLGKGKHVMKNGDAREHTRTVWV